jgi:hypothetical protein
MQPEHEPTEEGERESTSQSLQTTSHAVLPPAKIRKAGEQPANVVSKAR